MRAALCAPATPPAVIALIHRAIEPYNVFVPRLTGTPRVEQIRNTLYNHAETPVLFHITQVHTPETCPRDSGGSNSLFNPDVKGLKMLGRCANAQHTMFFIVEVDDVDAIHKFLWPGFARCTSTSTPVTLIPVPKD